jgi:steroid 5-alpha reductase family enzyme
MVLALNLAGLFLFFVLMWRLAVALHDCTFVDALWGLGMTATAAVTWMQTGGGTLRSDLIAALAIAWGLRMGVYMLWRWRTHGPDGRYRRMLERAEAERGWRFPYASFRMVFGLQAFLLWLVCLPAQVGQLPAEPAAPGPLGLAGAALAVFGLVYETVADWQLARFRQDPANAGQVMDRGLWRYSRHPNYFGDMAVWWGLWLLAAEVPWGWLTAVGPAFLSYTLIRWTGAPSIEGRMRRRKPAYEDYARRTSAFLPWPPKPPAA